MHLLLLRTLQRKVPLFGQPDACQEEEPRAGDVVLVLVQCCYQVSNTMLPVGCSSALIWLLYCAGACVGFEAAIPRWLLHCAGVGVCLEWVCANAMLVRRCALVLIWVGAFSRGLLRACPCRGTPTLSTWRKNWLMARYVNLLWWRLLFLGCCQTTAERCAPALVLWLSLAMFGVVQAIPVPACPPRVPRDRRYVTKHKRLRARQIITKRLARYPVLNSWRGATTVPDSWAQSTSRQPP